MATNVVDEARKTQIKKFEKMYAIQHLPKPYMEKSGVVVKVSSTPLEDITIHALVLVLPNEEIMIAVETTCRRLPESSVSLLASVDNELFQFHWNLQIITFCRRFCYF